MGISINNYSLDHENEIQMEKAGRSDFSCRFAHFLMFRTLIVRESNHDRQKKKNAQNIRFPPNDSKLLGESCESEYTVNISYLSSSKTWTKPVLLSTVSLSEVCIRNASKVFFSMNSYLLYSELMKFGIRR